jgi:deubiquitinase DESI2
LLDYSIDTLIFPPLLLDDDIDSASSSTVGDSDADELGQHLLPSMTDVDSIDVLPKLVKDHL